MHGTWMDMKKIKQKHMNCSVFISKHSILCLVICIPLIFHFMLRSQKFMFLCYLLAGWTLTKFTALHILYVVPSHQMLCLVINFFWWLMLDGQFEEWCIADEQTPDDELLKALNWACGKGGADCSKIQVNKPCFLPNTIRDHASYAFNNYYQKFKHIGATCYFNAAAMITDLDPSKISTKSQSHTTLFST